MARPGVVAAYFGPCVCDSPSAARELAEWAIAKHAGQPVVWDLFPDHHAAVRLARELGFEPCRRLVRMVRRGPGRAPSIPAWTAEVYAIAGFEYG
jgi:hypothetical protein